MKKRGGPPVNPYQPPGLWKEVIKGGPAYKADLQRASLDALARMNGLRATIMHLLGILHERLTYRFQGREYRLTDVHGQVVRDILV